MDNKYKICAVVVTFNRKELLINCLNAINQQTYKPHTVLIVDNASTDGTKDFVMENEYYNVEKNGIDYKYLLLPNNQGGAGGFYNGMKTAYESLEQFDAVWVMDDDGVPSMKCLSELQKYLDKSSFISPLVCNIEKHSEMAFGTLKETNIDKVNALYPTGIVKNHANPFNGILFKRDLMDKIGFPKKEMFIWGDENEYEARAIKNGFEPMTILTAKHFHPKDRLVLFPDFLGRKNIVFVASSPLRCYCKYRNTSYVLVKYKGLLNLVFYVFRYLWYFIISRKFDVNNAVLFCDAVCDGIKGDFSNHNKFLKK